MDDILMTDSDWKPVAGEYCKIIQFIPFAKMEGGAVVRLGNDVSYGLIKLRHPRLAPDTCGSVGNEVDFRHLWAAFEERGIRDEEEVMAIWMNHKLDGIVDEFRPYIPRFALMICPGGAYEIATDDGHRPDLTGEARWLAQRPLVSWPPV